VKTWDLERRILRVWHKATPLEAIEGRDWYPAAQREAAQISHLSIDPALANGIPSVSIWQAAGVIAAISPGLRWERNVWWANELVQAWYRGEAERLKVPTYSYANVRKAIRIISGESPAYVLSGPKVTAFYRLIETAGASGDVCVDSHAYNLSVGLRAPIRGDKAVRISRPALRRVRAAYIKLAGKLGVPPAVLQATTWLTWRRLREQEVPF
jgi:hypothetical protein